MEIQVKKLREALQLLAPVVGKGRKVSTLPVLANVQLGDGKAVATNLEAAIAVDLPEATERLLAPMAPVVEFLDRVAGYSMATITVDGQDMVLAVVGTEARFRMGNIDDYPPLPEVRVEHEAVLVGDSLVKALMAVVDCAATDDKRPVLTAVALHPGEPVMAVGADGFRLAYETVPGKLPGEKPLLIPRGTVAVLEHLWRREAVPDIQGITDPVQIAMAKRLIRLTWDTEKMLLQMRFGRISLVSQLVSGAYPNYQELIPADGTAAVTVDAEDLLRAVQQVQRIAADSSGIARLQWEDSRLTVSARAEGVGVTRVQVPATCTAPGEIAFNVRYLLHYATGKTGQVGISMTTPSSPAKFSHRQTANLVVMPMFVQWDGKPGEQAKEPTGDGAQPAGQVTEGAAAASAPAEAPPERPEESAEFREEPESTDGVEGGLSPEERALKEKPKGRRGRKVKAA